MFATSWVPVGYVQLTVGGTVGGLSGTAGNIVIPSRATRILMGCETSNIRWRDDGGPLAAGVGMLLVAAQQPFDYSGSLSKLQFLSTGAPATLNVAYYAEAG